MAYVSLSYSNIGTNGLRVYIYCTLLFCICVIFYSALFYFICCFNVIINNNNQDSASTLSNTVTLYTNHITVIKLLFSVFLFIDVFNVLLLLLLLFLNLFNHFISLIKHFTSFMFYYELFSSDNVY